MADEATPSWDVSTDRGGSAEPTTTGSPTPSAANAEREPAGAVDAAPYGPLADLARIVLSDETLETVLDRIAHAAKRSMQFETEASVTLLSENGPTTAAQTGAFALRLDEEQYGAGDGPCLEAARSAGLMQIRDMRTETRWPRYTPHAAGLGALSSISAPLPVQQRVLGALNIYSTEVDAFDEDAVQVLEGFASYAAVALANAQLYATTAALAHHMEQAMKSRAVIEQAKGILMVLHGLDPDAAFGMLTQQSQRSHRKLREVAESIVEASRRVL
ncbi:MAG: histidine kinase [Frankiales bacterium]|nr:histidine kinase [Frankiales bacterium]